MYCPFCGYELPEEAKFCQHCGKQIPPYDVGVTVSNSISENEIYDEASYPNVTETTSQLTENSTVETENIGEKHLLLEFIEGLLKWLFPFLLILCILNFLGILPIERVIETFLKILRIVT
jgi:hypothetical protein